MPQESRRLPDDDNHLKRLALQIVAQLPEDTREAAAVLRYAAELLDFWLCPEEQDAPVPLREVPKGAA